MASYPQSCKLQAFFLSCNKVLLHYLIIIGLGCFFFFLNLFQLKLQFKDLMWL